MKKSIIRGLAVAVGAAALTLGLAAPASAVPPGYWTLTGKTPISSGYMYTYRSPAGGYFVTATFQGHSFVEFEVR